MAATDAQFYRLLADLGPDDTLDLMNDISDFETKLHGYSDEPLHLDPASEEEAEAATDSEVIMAAAGETWHSLSTRKREELLAAAQDAGASLSECAETLDLWEPR